MTLHTLPLRNARNELSPRSDFPIFATDGPNAGLIYLDSGASAQKPNAVIDAVSDFYRNGYANIHRGVYKLSANATEAYEGTRAKVAKFLNAASPNEIIFVRGATEALNLVAHSWGGSQLKAGDRVLITEMEHHANIVPWQMLRDRLGLVLEAIPIAADGGLDMDAYRALLLGKPKIVALTHVANATGAVNPVKEIARLAHDVGAIVVVDGCQAVAHRPVDVQDLGADFYAFSGHKIYGPTGIGILYGRRELLKKMPPYQTGGDMILSVTIEKTEFQDPPHRFEAGTPDIAGVIGLAAALEYVQSVGWDWIQSHEQALIQHGVEVLARVPGLTLMPAGPERSGIFSFTMDGVHPHDLSTVLDEHKVAVRAGTHCAQPLLAKLGVHATVRASLGLYNEASDLDALATALVEAARMFAQ